MTATVNMEELRAEISVAERQGFRAVWREFGRHGVLRAVSDERTFAEGCRLLEALGHHIQDGGIFVSIIASCGLAVPILRRSGEWEEVCERTLEGESVLAVGITEPSGGSDAFGVRTVLHYVDNRLVLSGRKWCITNAPAADHFIVFCQNVTGEQPTLAAVLVPRTTPGVSVGEPLHLVGCAGSPTGEVTFEDAPVDPRWILVDPAAGRELLQLAFLRERLLAPWPLIGRMSGALQLALDRVAARQQFGKPIKDYQYVQGKIVRGFERLDTARLLAHEAVRRFLDGDGAEAHASLAKYYAADSGVEVFRSLVELWGARGLMEDASLMSALSDALCATVAGGTREMQMRVVFDQLLLDRSRSLRRGTSRYFTTVMPSRGEERGT